MENRKIVIIGAGHVGSHCAYALAASGICEEIVLVDLIKEKAEAQALDVADSVSFMDHAVSVRAGSCSECRDAALTRQDKIFYTVINLVMVLLMLLPIFGNIIGF